VVLPTYNRADTIRRAIASVEAQTVGDFELIVVDDGSTDDTVSLIRDVDPRTTLIRQENRGSAEARNAGIRASTGEYLAFLDSDDEWLPYHLELCLAFLKAFPDQHFVGAELLEDFGQARLINHYRVETSEWYPQKANRIRSRSLDLRDGKTDAYLRFYDSRETIGDWGCHILTRAGRTEDAFHYSGWIFEHLRWGYLFALPATVIRRPALEKVGLPDAGYRAASDYHFIAKLCQHFRANFLSLPTYIKHELNPLGRVLAEGHVATGRTALACMTDLLRSYEDLFWQTNRDDRELCALRGLRQYTIAQIALQVGERDVALHYLKETRKNLPEFWGPIALELFVRSLPQVELSRKVWTGLTKGAYAWRQVLRGELPLRMAFQKALGRVRRTGH
jgi:glycosyltransferase involved in cell wall biosynthesis